jgi:hypothetical protein
MESVSSIPDREFEFTTQLRQPDGRRLVIRVSKAGGGTWQGWKDKYPVKGRPKAADVTGCKSRQDAAEALRELWDDSHGPAPRPPRT